MLTTNKPVSIIANRECQFLKLIILKSPPYFNSLAASLTIERDKSLQLHATTNKSTLQNRLVKLQIISKPTTSEFTLLSTVSKLCRTVVWILRRRAVSIILLFLGACSLFIEDRFLECRSQTFRKSGTRYING